MRYYAFGRSRAGKDRGLDRPTRAAGPANLRALPDAAVTPVPGGTIVAIAGRLFLSSLARLWVQWCRQHTYGRCARQLHELDNKLLRDIGIENRRDIDYLLRNGRHRR